jgi:cell division protein FtsB
MVDEYEQFKERNEALERTNKKLNENNEILFEENGVNRELVPVINITFHVTTY